MNFLTFVFTLLLIFSFGTFALIEKQAGDRSLRSSYIGHLAAIRKILAKQESATYQALAGKRSEPAAIKPMQNKESEVEFPETNPSCARLNLWPLIQEGREKHPALYDVALKLLKTFYHKNIFQNAQYTETSFLNALLEQAKTLSSKQEVCLEKILFIDELRIDYYRMLKGTKNWDPMKKIGYPSLLEIFKAEEIASKICIEHAHFGQIQALFGEKPAMAIFLALHQKESKEPISKELLERLCQEAHVLLDHALFDVIATNPSSHGKKEKATFMATDHSTDVSLKKTLYRI